LKDPLLWAEISLPDTLSLYCDHGNIHEGGDLWEASVQHSDSDSIVFEGSQLREKMHHRAAEARIHILTEFMECCASSQLPLKTVETIQHIGVLAIAKSNGVISHDIG
jgi:hypothetical protein